MVSFAKMKKSVSGLLIILVLISICVNPVMAEETEIEYKNAEVVFGSSSDVMSNMTWRMANDSNEYTKVEKGGKYGVECSPEDGKMYLCFFVSDNYWYTQEPSDIAVTVEYYDEGSGKFSLRYNSENNDRWATPYDEDGWDIVEMTGANQWKSHTFYLDDCIMNNDLMYSADMEIGLWTSEMGKSDDSIVFGSMKIEEVYPKNPVKTKISSGDYAHIYDENDTDKLSIILENKTADSFNTLVSYTITDYEGAIVKADSYNAEISSLNGNETEISTGIEKFGIYNISITTEAVRESDKNTYKNTENFKISKVLTTQNGDKKNNYLKICTHLHEYDNQENAINQVARAGFSGIRQEYFYSTALSEGAKVGAENGLALNSLMKERINLVKENNLEMLQILAYDKEGGEVVIPESSTDIEGFADYCAFMAKELLGVTNKFEIWNEPNHENFSGDGQSASDYVKLLKAAYNAIIDVNPEAEIYAGALASAESTSYLHQMFWAGAKDYCHGISIHPYTWYPQDAFNHQERIETISDFLDVLKLYRVNKPVIFSEIGWTTSDCDSGVTEIEQAIYAVQLPTISMAHNLADEVYWYTLKSTGSSKTETNNHFGITEYYKGENANTAKPAYVALAAYNKFMAGDVSLIESIEASDLSTAAHIFENESGKKTAVFWATGQEAEIDVNLGHCKVSVYDMYGNKLETLYSDEGVYKVSAGTEPKYLISDYEASPSALSSVSTEIDYEKREVTVKGEIINRNIDEEMTIVVVPKGILPENNPEQIIYVNQVEVDTNSFEHIFTVPTDSTEESYDIYLCGNYVENMQSGIIEYLSLKVATLDFTGDSTQLTATAYASNHLGKDKEIAIIIAQYQNGVLMKTDIENKTVSNNTDNIPVSLTVEKANGATSYKAFVLDSMENIKPLCGMKEI